MSARELVTEHLDLWTEAVTQKSTRGRGSNGKIELTGIKKLRELILELAVQGKLIEQNVSDEPASLLLQKICNIRKILIDQKKIKSTKPLPPVSSDESPYALPSGWAWTCLGSLAEISPRNSTDDYTEASFVPMPLITTSYHGEHDSEIRPWSEIKKGYTHFADGDIGLAKITPCFENSKAAIFRNLSNGVGAGTTELHIARPLTQDINPYFILLFLKSPRFLSEGERVMTGSAGQKRVPKSYFASTPLPLPPKAEQHRIVQKVDELMALCDQLEQQTSDQLEAHETLVDTLLGTLTQSQDATELADNWARLTAHFDTLFTTEQSIDKFKQTILQLAVMGRLVEQDAGDEPVCNLRQRIATTKTQLIETGALRKQRPSPALEQAKVPFPSPGTWEWVTFGEITFNRDAERIPLPVDDRRKRNGEFDYYGASGVIDSIDDYLFDSPLLLIGEDGANLINRSTPIAFIARGKYWVNNHAHVIDGISEDFLRYLCLYINAISLEPYVTGTAQPKMNQAKMNAIPVPLPPENEQVRIVQKVDELMVLCDQLKERLNQACETRCQLAQTIVKQAVS